MVHFFLSVVTGIMCIGLLFAYFYGCYRLSSYMNGYKDDDSSGTLVLAFSFPLITVALYYFGDSILKVVFP